MEGLLLPLSVIILAINIGSFIFVGVDKKKSLTNEPRLPEVYFFFLSAFLGALGVLVGMFVFRHKVRKLSFLAGITSILVQNIILLMYLGEKLNLI